MAEHVGPAAPLDDVFVEGIFAPPPTEEVAADPREPMVAETAAANPAEPARVPRPKRRLPQCKVKTAEVELPSSTGTASSTAAEEPDEFLTNCIAAAFAMGGIAALGANPKPTGLYFFASLWYV